MALPVLRTSLKEILMTQQMVPLCSLYWPSFRLKLSRCFNPRRSPFSQNQNVLHMLEIWINTIWFCCCSDMLKKTLNSECIFCDINFSAFLFCGLLWQFSNISKYELLLLQTEIWIHISGLQNRCTQKLWTLGSDKILYHRLIIIFRLLFWLSLEFVNAYMSPIFLKIYIFFIKKINKNILNE